ncbi:MAG: hypothetical protein ACU85V_02320 [Gammaproteobacteria bacterium]
MRIIPLTTLAGAVMAAGLCLDAAANVTFSVDYQGPTAGGAPVPGPGIPDAFFGTPIDGAAILTPALPGPPGPNPPAPGAAPPPGIVVDSTVGGAPRSLRLPGPLELDALSYGRDRLFEREILFSVDEFAVGAPSPLPPPGVLSEGGFGALEASADVFAYAGPPGPVPPGPVFGNVAVIDGDGVPPFGGPSIGLIEPNPPTPGVVAPGLPDQGDNLDALDYGTSAADLAGPIYFSLESGGVFDPIEGVPGSGSAPAAGFVGGDILCDGCPGAAGLSLFAGAGILGLDLMGPDTDDLDALLLVEDGDGVLSAADLVLFSVRRGSAVIGLPDSAFGAPIEAGDILTLPVPGAGTPAIFIAAEALGLATVRSGVPLRFQGFGDELDALTAPVPVPAGLPLLASALAGLGLAWRRRPRAPARR